MQKNLNEVISYFESLYRNKAVYLWGANGETITKELCDQLYRSYGSSVYNKTYYENKYREGAGKIGADCSEAMYPMSGFDTTAQGYYNQCTAKGSISSLPQSTPCLVFKGRSPSSIHHMGFYLGNGYVIELKSSKENCVKDKLEGKGWNWYGIPGWISYSSAGSQDTPPVHAKCVDVSSYQSDIDWNLVRSDGIHYAILKIIRKDLKPDSKFEQNWKGCEEAGIHIDGVYNYSYAATVPKAKLDAQAVLSVLDGRTCTIWLDLEDKCQQGLGSLLKDIINAYRDVIVSAGYEFGIYTGPSFYNPFIKPYISQISCDKWWLARYYNSYRKMPASTDPNEQYNPKSMTGIDPVYAWQYTSSGEVAGIRGNVDLSMLYLNKKN